MRSSFFGLNVAQQGLYTARTALDIANHNISNAETVGYSRQYGVQKALNPLSNASRGMVGTGSEIANVSQYRNEYLDFKYWSMTKDLGAYEVKNNALTQMELVFNEPTDVGFTAYFDDVFKTLQGLSKNPSDEASKTNFVNSLESFTKYITDISEQFDTLQNEANFGVKTSVDQINFVATQIATINQQIGNLELTGDRANDLRDERMRLIDTLSKVISIDTNFSKDINGVETLDITINGQQLVHGSTMNLLEVRLRDFIQNPEDNVDMYDIYWQSGKRLYTENTNLSGELKGYLDIRDGNNSDNFKGTISAGAGTANITLTGVSRHDIPASGQIVVNGLKLNYSSFTYDDITGNMNMTLDPATPCPVGATACSIGNPITFKGIPYYVQQLNEFVRTFSRSINTVHQSGDNNTGLPLLTFDNYTGVPALNTNLKSTYDQMTIRDFAVNDTLLNNASLLKTKFNTADGPGANDLVIDMINLRHDTNMFAKGVPDNFIQALISELGIDAKQISSFKSGQEHLTALITNQRLSISDVDLDEEATNIVKFQQAYNMAAKIMSVFDEIYDVTINQMGSR